ncbi:hypothetical protein HDF18_17835 [Mucilaginibacter sp. X5P1]|uniref:hypothetical protein n=1 Tax=Mucilaginibacter sp. X5P1 TaxID=2723088 RepID=UPI00160FC570|nr:hypothetical protein [Mucilaginibacter sp. X5P1]MBB6139500.1 hypothetical protein [Mucilaginibacter sp. X5P1]
MAAIDIYAAMEDPTKSISDRVKTAILFEDGYNNPDPSTLDDGKQMSTFNFDPGDYINITKYFNRIIITLKPGGQTLDPNDVSDLSAVKDCETTVTDACK